MNTAIVQHEQKGTEPTGTTFGAFCFAHPTGKVQVLHIDLWYANGSAGEINITSPHTYWGEDLERQYLYMRMYLQKSAPDLGIIAYQGSMVFVNGDELRTISQYAKVDCSTIKPFKPGQFCDHD